MPARQELVKATNVQPANPESWEQLGEFDLSQHEPVLAVLELQTAKLLDRSSATLDQELAAAEQALSQSGLSAPPAPVSIRLSSGGPSTARTCTSPNPNSPSSARSEAFV